MNHFKLSKKKIYKDDRSTIENIHEEKMNSIDDKFLSLENKKEELKNLEEILLSLNIRSENKYKILNNIETLKKEIYEIENNHELIDYLSKALPFLSNLDIQDSATEFNTESDTPINSNGILNFVNKVGESNKGQDYNNYISSCFGNKLSVDKNYNSNKCLNCDSTMFENDHRESTTICIKCGICTELKDTSSSNINFSELTTIEYTNQPFCYQRLNHFKEWLNQLQGREVTVIPDTVIDLILLEFKKQRIYNIDDINSIQIKSFLKKLKLSKYYEHVPNIITRITNKPPLRIDDNFEKILLNLFDKIQAPFKKHCPKDRKNFLSYSYTLYKFCQILDKNEYLIFFPLLKSREKLFEQEKIWKKICEELNWRFISSI